jgi:signal peptide peptidase SppA
MSLLLRIAERVLNRPLLVHADKVPLILGVLEGRIPVGDVAELRAVADANIDAMPADAQRIMRGPHPGASRFVGDAFENDPATGKKRGLPYRRTADGVAVITITGSLINRGAWVGSDSGETSYEGIKYQVAAAAADPRARAILLDIESPGGEAVGAFEAAQAIRDAAKAKPVTAVVNGMAASAAYALASGANRIVTTPTGLTGSIGVVMVHADYSGFLEQKGIKPTLIFAGAHKVDGNPFEPLPPGVRDDLQAEVDQFYALFVKTVSAGRNGLSAAAIRATEARTFIGKDAVDAGLADGIGTFESVLADITRGLGRATSTAKGATMDNAQGAPAATAGITQQQLDAAVTTARAEGQSAGEKTGAENERKRLATILGHEKVKGNAASIAAAIDLAGKSPGMSAEDVVSFVADHAVGAKAQPPKIAERLGGQGSELAMGTPIQSASTAQGSWAKAISRLPGARKQAVG